VLDIARTAAMAGFDRARPLWEYTLVDGLEGGRSALVLKVHHSMTDGVGGMKLLLMLFDFERDPEPVPPLDRVDAVPVYEPLDLVLGAIGHAQRRALGIARRTVVETVGVTNRLLDDPMGSVKEAARAAGSVVRFLTPATVPCSPLLTARTMARDLSVLEVPLDDMKRAAKSVGGSLNDAFVAAVIGGMQRYHEFHGMPVDQLRMVMPINVRGSDAALGGNHFTPARFLVPIAIKDPAERIVALGQLTRQIRDEPAVHLTEALAGVLNQLPTTVTTALFGSMLKGADFVTSNVPGAPFPIYAAGAELERMFPFAPLAGAAVNVTLLSHCGTCCIGVNVDSVAVPDSTMFVQCLDEGFTEILALS
jgi:WS/DGAT/MGAT family acyltransferase